MKIAILTHPLKVNYGGILQAFALSTILMKQGHEVAVLNRLTNKPFFKRIVRSILLAVHHPRYNNPKYKQLVYFIQKHINYTKPLSTSSSLTKYVTKNNIEIVIVGSDQVWRADFAMSYGYNYFLDFVPACIRKLSYAASFGISEWEYSKEQTSNIKDLVKRFKSVSVREDEGVSLCKDNLGIRAEHVLDPTMLLEADDYDAITSKPLVNGNYVFVYWLGSDEEKQKALANSNIADKKIIDISLRGREPLMPIENWLSYIKYADRVVTDSFHGCVLSIFFQKQFTICANNSGGNGRLRSLLTMLGIDPAACNINYDAVTKKLNENRASSYRFIKKALQ